MFDVFFACEFHNIEVFNIIGTFTASLGSGIPLLNSANDYNPIEIKKKKKSYFIFKLIPKD